MEDERATPDSRPLSNFKEDVDNQWLDDIPFDEEVTMESYKEARPSGTGGAFPSELTLNPQQQSNSRRMVIRRNINGGNETYIQDPGPVIVKSQRISLSSSSTIEKPQIRRSRMNRDGVIFVDRKASTSTSARRKMQHRKSPSKSSSKGHFPGVTLRIEEQPTRKSTKQQRQLSYKSMPVLMEDIQFLPQPPKWRRSTDTSAAMRNREKRISLVKSKRKNYFIDHDDDDAFDDVVVRLESKDNNKRRSRSDNRRYGRHHVSSLTSGSTDDSGIYEEVRRVKPSLCILIAF